MKMTEKHKKKVLFVCTHNSARSQMAEALLNAFHGARYTAYSAGTEPSGVNPYAVRAMEELGVDISTHSSKSVEEFIGKDLDFVITVCDHAKETCPVFPGGKRHLHHSFNDPSAFKGSEYEKLAGFRKVRDEIKAWIDETFVKDS